MLLLFVTLTVQALPALFEYKPKVNIAAISSNSKFHMLLYLLLTAFKQVLSNHIVSRHPTLKPSQITSLQKEGAVSPSG